MLNALANRCHDNAIAHGFTVTDENTPEKLMLVVSELSEALEEIRVGNWDTSYELKEGAPFDAIAKPVGFPSELADAIIRILDITAAHGIDIERIVAEKMTYNESRPYKHGKKF